MGRGRATRLLGLLHRAGASLSEQSAGPVCRSSLPISSLGEIRPLATLAARHSTLPSKSSCLFVVISPVRPRGKAGLPQWFEWCIRHRKYPSYNQCCYNLVFAGALAQSIKNTNRCFWPAGLRSISVEALKPSDV